MDPASKALLRKAVRERIGLMPAAERRAADLAVCRHLLTLARELGTGTVLGYLAMADEVRIDAFLAAALEEGMEVLLPWSGEHGLGFRPWRPSSVLERDGQGVLAPPGADRDLDTSDGATVMAVPGRAFDLAGGRLGRGGGYYDRLLAGFGPGPGRVVGVAYACQVVEQVPREAHDRTVDLLVTEQGCRRVGPAGLDSEQAASRTPAKDREGSGFER